jgi:hypothetical protein
MNHWLLEDKIYSPELLDHKEVYGFVYLIENLINGRKYIGKKFFWSAKTRQVNKKKKRYKAESDWKDYYGSSAELLGEISNIGKESFKRTILHICKTKAECAYLELKEQIERNVLLSDEYYNAWIQVKVRKSHLKHLKKVVYN